MGINFVENNNKMTDNEVISQINAGNYELLSVIIERYLPLIVKIAKQYLPSAQLEDAVQEATFALYSAIKNYDGQKATFKTFATVCIKRSVISILRKTNALKSVPQELISSIDEVEITDINTPEEILIEKEDYKALTNNIKLELSDMEYNVLELFLSGKGYSDIAKALGITEKSVDNALARIRKKIKK